MTDTEPLDLDALILVEAEARDRLRDADTIEHATDYRIMYSLADGVDALIAEVRRLRGKSVSEGDIRAWFTSHSSAAVARVVAYGQSVIDERMADGVFK